MIWGDPLLAVHLPPTHTHHPQRRSFECTQIQEMSDEYKAAQARLMLEQASDVDIIVTTALIPGRKAPVLVNQEMLDVMKAGSVIVDLAAANGGNVAQTVPDEVITTANGVTIVGYTNLPSRLASTSSTLFGTNVAKFILSVGPQTTKEKGVYQIDLEDDAVQNMLVAYDGVRRYPDMITPFSPPPPKTSLKDAVALVALTDEEMRAVANEKQRAAFVKNAATASVSACALLAFGYANDSGDGGVSLLATFALAGLAGYQVVWGVAPALHSPLMAVTNAMSGEFYSAKGCRYETTTRPPALRGFSVPILYFADDSPITKLSLFVDP
jgi:NAD(P) transhydrogenase